VSDNGSQKRRELLCALGKRGSTGNELERRTSEVDGAQREDLPLLLAVPRAAKILGISRSAAYRLAESGDLPVKRMGGRIYVITAKLFALVDVA
jgi:excisionase family DNA binding protein